MIRFAEEHFNQWPRTSSGGTLGRRKSSVSMQRNITDPMPKAEMLQYAKGFSLPTSMVHLHNPANVVLACSMYKDLSKHIRKELKQDQVYRGCVSVFFLLLLLLLYICSVSH